MKSGRRRGRVLCNWKVTKRKVFRLLFLLKIVVAPPRFLDIYPLLPFDQPEIRLGVMFSSKEVKTLAETKSIRKNVNFEQGKQDWKSSFFISVGVIDWKLQRWRKVYWVHTSVLFFGILSLSCTNEASTFGCMYYMLKSAFYTLLIELSSWRAPIGTFEVTSISCYLIIIALKPKARLIKTNFLITLCIFCQFENSIKAALAIHVRFKCA